MTVETEHSRKYEAIRSEFPQFVTKRFECDVGWFPILREFFAVVRQAIPPGSEDVFVLLQVKEKLGGLRIHYRLGKQVAAAEAQIHDAYSAAEARASKTCEVCSRPGVFRIQNGAWLMTRCEDHAEGGVPVPPPEGVQ